MKRDSCTSDHTWLKVTLEQSLEGEDGDTEMENGERHKLALTVTEYVKQIKKIERDTEILEDHIKELKAKKKELTEVVIPELFSEAGVSSLKLLDDTKVDVKPFYYARINRDKETEFFDWLQKNGHGGLIKSHFEVWSRQGNLTTLLEEFCKHVGIEYQMKDDIHWQTLQKWYGEMCEKGIKINTELFDNYPGRRATIKS